MVASQIRATIGQLFSNTELGDEMDTIAYNHLVSSYESPQQLNLSDNLILFRGVNWSKVSTTCLMPIIGAAISLSILGATSAAQASIYYGSSGNHVVQLQNALANHGYFRARSTGYFGSMTKHSVKAFQRDYGLAVDGIVGPATASALGLHCYTSCYVKSYPKHHYGYHQASHRPRRGRGYHKSLSHGDSSSRVANLQHKLAYYGYFHARATGYFGPITTKAVKAFQRDYGLRVDGVAGPATLAALGM
ncbi:MULTISPECIES: peptidoglycan-binding domain-containing protein [Oscillatoriales]|nr:peptidoglycan-binding protein [Arthrospira platensis]MDF2207633.1 peptidoglycan-binding protein [Arthrospira platensis NCB002]MDT9184696.1 peptidoglycan-binding protein [Limnospira sp. PMC 289.06]MDT9296866.1 peptidoglycan-binding protein [Arthrospira platensis PCC 7345]QQW32192.2 peptidoglycan-binding protein [Arthrospira sp. PCC 9108]